MESQPFNLIDSLLSLTLIGAEWVLWLLLALSVLSVAIIIERILFFTKLRTNFALFSQGLSDALRQDDYEKAERMCEDNNALVSKVTRMGLKNRARSITAFQGSMEGLVVGERTKLERGLVVLGTLGNNAPFIGLFGTVIGIIKAFHDLASNPQGGPSVVMAGISEALVATAVGLLVAIPAVIAFNAFTRVVKNHVANAQSVIKLMVTFHH
ncbi:MAG: MotA/TolQ/ExbB proton channel family protein [Deltaproteobacteria bacterium]|nr:MotA/TolQ/ExbB proton channel family protein [Deltaproteobacteria bacterium]